MRVPSFTCIGLLSVALLTLFGCADNSRSGDHAPGVVVTSDGRFLANTADNHRQETERHMGSELTAEARMPVQVKISELPRFIASGANPDDGEFRWDTATITVTTANTEQMALTDAITTYLNRRVRGGAANITVQFQAASTTSAPVVAAPTNATDTTTARSYTVQPGDTLADISTLFYGAPEHWRRITAANPTLDPASLMPGTVLIIPRE